MPSIKNLKSPKKTFECQVPYWILAVKSTSIKFWYKVLTTHIHKWCQSTFWQNWVKYITEIYGERWFWKLRIKLSWLIWLKLSLKFAWFYEHHFNLSWVQCDLGSDIQKWCSNESMKLKERNNKQNQTCLVLVTMKLQDFTTCTTYDCHGRDWKVTLSHISDVRLPF